MCGSNRQAVLVRFKNVIFSFVTICVCGLHCIEFVLMFAGQTKWLVCFCLTVDAIQRQNHKWIDWKSIAVALRHCWMWKWKFRLEWPKPERMRIQMMEIEHFPKVFHVCPTKLIQSTRPRNRQKKFNAENEARRKKTAPSNKVAFTPSHTHAQSNTYVYNDDIQIRGFFFL